MPKGAAAIAMLFVLSAFLLPASVSADPSLGTVTVYGYLGDVSNEEGNVPLDGVNVTFLDSAKNELGSCITGDGGEPGRFQCSFPSGMAVYVKFDMQGYTVRTWPNNFSGTPESNLLSFSFSSTPVDTDGKYRLTGDVSSGTFIAMSITEAHIYGHVDDGSGNMIKGAHVRLTSSEGRVYSATTDGDGYFDTKVYWGVYSMVVSCTGFHSSDPIEVSTSGPMVLVSLSERDNTLFFGLDLPHTLEAIGLMVAALILALVLVIVYRQRSGHSLITIVNDIEDDDADERRRFGP